MIDLVSVFTRRIYDTRIFILLRFCHKLKSFALMMIIRANIYKDDFFFFLGKIYKDDIYVMLRTTLFIYLISLCSCMPLWSTRLWRLLKKLWVSAVLIIFPYDFCCLNVQKRTQFCGGYWIRWLLWIMNRTGEMACGSSFWSKWYWHSSSFLSFTCGNC